MIKALNPKGIATVGEYLLTFTLVIAVVIGMATYFQRAMQGRMRDARHMTITNLREACRDTNCVGQGAIGEGYEPYYQQITSNVASRTDEFKGMVVQNSQHDFFSQRSANNQNQSQSNQLAPINAVNDQVIGRQ